MQAQGANHHEEHHAGHEQHVAGGLLATLVLSLEMDGVTFGQVEFAAQQALGFLGGR